MATKLSKKLSRETDVIPNSAPHQPQGFGKSKGRNIIISIESPNVISFRLKGTRQEFSTNVESCFRVAVYQELMHQYKKDKALYQVKKDGGMKRLRKPVKPFFPLGL